MRQCRGWGGWLLLSLSFFSRRLHSGEVTVGRMPCKDSRATLVLVQEWDQVSGYGVDFLLGTNLITVDWSPLNGEES